MSSSASSPSPSRRPLALKLNAWWRAAAVVLGLAGLGAGGAAVFITHVEAGPVALLIVGLILLLIGMGGRMPSRIKVGDNEAAWEAVQEFVERVADEVPDGARPELLDALGDLAEAAPQAAAAVLSAWAYENLIIAMLEGFAIRTSADTADRIEFDPLNNDRLFDGLLRAAHRRVAIQIKAHKEKLSASTLAAFSGLVATERNRSALPMTGLLISRTELTHQADRLLGTASYIYVAVIRGPQDHEKLAEAVRSALELENRGSYFD